jgi:spore maturation protein CgeB
MKIAIIGSNKFDSLEFHLNDELQFQGYNSQIFDLEKVFSYNINFGLSLLSDSYVWYMHKRLLDRVLNFTPELIICVYRHIHPLFVKLVKQKGIKIIHVNPDPVTTFQSQQLFVEKYDAYFTKDYFIHDFMVNKLGLNAFHYFEAFNPRVHKVPVEEKAELEVASDIDVLAFGTIYPYRARFLKILEDSGINISIYGHKSRFTDKFAFLSLKDQFISGLEKSRLIYSSKIVLNNFHYAEIYSVNNKFFEIFGSGGFQICDFKETLKEVIPIDPKLISFNSVNEAEELIKFYLKNPDRRFDIQKQIYPFFLENFTYKNLINSVFSKI